MKLKTDAIKSKNGLKFSQQVIVIALLILTVVIVLVMNYMSSAALKDTVDIVVLKTSVQKDGLITQGNLERRNMIRAEYEKYGTITLANGAKRRTVVLWEDRGGILNSFAGYYLRNGAPIYWDSLTKDAPKKNSYLYQMSGELMKLDVSTRDFGDLLVPGDRVNIRVTYFEKDYKLLSEEEYYASKETSLGFSFGSSSGASNSGIEKNEMLFNEVRILDMLNSAGDSIFDIFYELIAMPKSEQIATVNSDDFKQRTRPALVLLDVTMEEADRYVYIQGKSPTFFVTMLPRTGSNTILESLNELMIGTGR